MARFEVEVVYRLRRHIVVNAKDEKQARAEAVKVVAGWPGPFEIEAHAVGLAKVYPPKVKTTVSS